jgi:hypothetical protein
MFREDSMKKLSGILAAVALLALACPVLAQDNGRHEGFSEESGQGNTDNDNQNANPDNEGQTTLSGPKGQVDKGNTDCNNCELDLPGKNR